VSQRFFSKRVMQRILAAVVDRLDALEDLHPAAGPWCRLRLRSERDWSLHD
jgi:hypothetical protein